MDSQNQTLSANAWSSYCDYVGNNSSYFQNSINTEETKSGSIPIAERTPTKNFSYNDVLRSNQKSSIKAKKIWNFSVSAPVFNKVLISDCLLVDKTLLIQKIVEKTDYAILITRPRRWGKTLNMKMIKAFLHPQKDNSGNLINEALFTAKRKNVINQICKTLNPRKLAIATKKKFIQKYAGKVPVIFITFDNIEYKNSEDLISGIHENFWTAIVDAFREHKDVYDDLKIKQKEDFDSLIESDLKTFKEYLHYSPKLNLKDSIKFLSYFLKNYYKGTKVCIIIDEYDAPFNNLDNEEAYTIVVDRVKVLLKSWIKNNENNVQKAIITGVLANVKADIFSGLNHICEDNVLYSEFSEYFGFTEQEVNSLLTQCLDWKTEKELDLLKMDIKSWYDGYNIGGIKIYNPFSIIKCLKATNSNTTIKINRILKPYWIATGEDNIKLNSLIKNFSGTENFTRLMKTGYLKLNMELETTVKLSSIEQQERAFFTYLLNLGYLTFIGSITKQKNSSHSKQNQWIYAVPNKEVKNYVFDILFTSLMEKIKQNNPDLDLNSLVSRLNQNLENSEIYHNIIKNEILNNWNNANHKEIDFQVITAGAVFFAQISNKKQKHDLWNEYVNDYRCRADALYTPIKGQSTTVVVHEYKKLFDSSMECVDRKAMEAVKQIYDRYCMDPALFMYKNDNYYSYFTTVLIRGVVFYKLGTHEKWNVKIIELCHDIEDALKINCYFKNTTRDLINCQTIGELHKLINRILSNNENMDRAEEGQINILDIANATNQAAPTKRVSIINTGRNVRSRKK